MTPAKKRLRKYDPVKTRAAVLAQAGHVGEAVRALTPEQLDLPAGLGDWTVAELVAHLATGLDSLHASTRAPEPPRAEVPLLDWPFGTSSRAASNAEQARELAAGSEPAALYGEVAERFAALLPEIPDSRIVAARAGAMTLVDFLVTRILELVVHTDDLSRATGVEIPYDRQALACCVRFLADALAAAAPGGSVEVRVPPYAVVQCIEGPRHTRGTPPNVVETDPLTWIGLATGRTAWKTALDEARISASGERADLAHLLPLMG